MKKKMFAAILRENEASDTTDEIYDDEDEEKRRKEEKMWEKVELTFSPSLSVVSLFLFLFYWVIPYGKIRVLYTVYRSTMFLIDWLWLLLKSTQSSKKDWSNLLPRARKTFFIGVTFLKIFFQSC